MLRKLDYITLILPKCNVFGIFQFGCGGCYFVQFSINMDAKTNPPKTVYRPKESSPVCAFLIRLFNLNKKFYNSCVTFACLCVLGYYWGTHTHAVIHLQKDLNAPLNADKIVFCICKSCSVWESYHIYKTGSVYLWNRFIVAFYICKSHSFFFFKINFIQIFLKDWTCSGSRIGQNVY